MKRYFIILLAITFLSGCDLVMVSEGELEKAVKKSVEKAYFEGQKDALNGDIRIQLSQDSCYIWVKSPWDCGDVPIYTPTRLDSQVN